MAVDSLREWAQQHLSPLHFHVQQSAWVHSMVREPKGVKAELPGGEAAEQRGRTASRGRRHCWSPALLKVE